MASTIKQTTTKPASTAQTDTERYTSRGRLIYEAIENIWTEKWTLSNASREMGVSKEELATRFAVFGMQAMEALRSKNVFDETLFLAIGKNQEGYGTPMDEALEEARGQKGKEAAFRRKQQGLPLTRGNHDDLECEIKALNLTSGNATRSHNRQASSGANVAKNQITRQIGETAPVSGNLQTIFHGQYGGQWAGGRPRDA